MPLCSYRSMVSKTLKQCQLITKNCLDLSGSDKAPSNTWAAVSRFVAELLPTEIDDRCASGGLVKCCSLLARSFTFGSGLAKKGRFQRVSRLWASAACSEGSRSGRMHMFMCESGCASQLSIVKFFFRAFLKGFSQSQRFAGSSGIAPAD